MACLLPCGALFAQAPQPRLSRSAIRQARAILLEMRDTALQMPEPNEATGSPKEPSLLDIVSLYQDIGDARSARETIKLIKTDSIRSVAWCMIAMAMSQHGNPTQGLVIVKAIPDSDYRERCFRDLADFQVEATNIGSSAIMETVSLVADPAARVALLGQLAVRQAKAGKQREAAQLFQRAMSTTEEINDEMWRLQALIGIASDHSKAGDDADARQTLLQLRRNIAVLRDASNKRYLLHSLVKAQAQAGDYREALETVKAFADWQSASSALKNMIQEQLRKGDIENAISTVSQNSNMSDRDGLLLQIAEAQAKKDDCTGVIRTASMVQYKSSSKEYIQKEIAGCQARAGQVEAALQTASDITDPYIKADALYEIGFALTKKGTRLCRHDVLQKAFETGVVARDYSPNNLLHEIAWAQAECGDMDAARKTAAVIPDDMGKAETMDSISYSQANRGEVKQALAKAREERDPQVRFHALWGVVRALTKTGSPPVRIWEGAL